MSGEGPRRPWPVPRPARRLLPFLRWLPLDARTLRADAVAGLTVALVLVPQSMAYAQLAGLPAHYGLYTAFLPVMIAALWGSSHQLATGPVAVVSLLTASTLAPLAASRSERFVALAIALALLVGVVQLAMGLLRLGRFVSFLSHPVILGFTNAAAIIIALSQVSKLFGIPMGRSEQFFQDVWAVALQLGETHWPTLAMGLSAFAIMWITGRFLPRVPGVLVAVVVTTLASWAIGFEKRGQGTVAQIADPEVRALAEAVDARDRHAVALSAHIAARNAELRLQDEDAPGGRQHAAAIRYQLELARLELAELQRENRKSTRDLRKFVFERTDAPEGTRYVLAGTLPPEAAGDGRRWRISAVRNTEVSLIGGGEVVGRIPSGLPPIAVPALDWDTVATLLSSAFVIALVGFMEAISIAKAMATRTRQRLDPNQELVGQGLGNLAGSLSSCFPASGSFSRSAVNLSAGARTGMSSIFAGLVVLLTLLLLTPLLYHLPQAVLAAIIMAAVTRLVDFAGVRHAWQATRHDGVAAIVTFVATLAFAPHLDSGILAGAGLAVVLFLYRTMTPRVAILGRHADGTLRDVEVFPDLPRSDRVVALRFDGRLYFANVPWFEDTILEAVAANPRASHLLVVGDGINELDASGEEAIRHLVSRLREAGVTVVFSGLKRQVLEVMQRTGLIDLVGAHNLHADEELALARIARAVGDDGIAGLCAPPSPRDRGASR